MELLRPLVVLSKIFTLPCWCCALETMHLRMCTKWMPHISVGHLSPLVFSIDFKLNLQNCKNPSKWSSRCAHEWLSYSGMELYSRQCLDSVLAMYSKSLQWVKVKAWPKVEKVAELMCSLLCCTLLKSISMHQNAFSLCFFCRITFCHLPFQSKWLYIGTERGNVHIVHIESFNLSGYVINWNKAIEL